MFGKNGLNNNINNNNPDTKMREREIFKYLHFVSAVLLVLFFAFIYRSIYLYLAALIHIYSRNRGKKIRLVNEST